MLCKELKRIAPSCLIFDSRWRRVFVSGLDHFFHGERDPDARVVDPKSVQDIVTKRTISFRRRSKSNSFSASQ